MQYMLLKCSIIIHVISHIDFTMLVEQSVMYFIYQYF